MYEIYFSSKGIDSYSLPREVRTNKSLQAILTVGLFESKKRKIIVYVNDLFTNRGIVAIGPKRDLNGQYWLHINSRNATKEELSTARDFAKAKNLELEVIP